MKLSISAFQSDVLALRWRDLALLALGFCLRDGGLAVHRGAQPADIILIYKTRWRIFWGWI